MSNPTLTPTQTRAQDSDFVAQCGFAALRQRLPFLWPAPDDVPPSPKQSYRSCYVYGGYADLDKPTNWEHFSDPKNLHNPRYADYARLFGFQDGVFPTEGGLRHWLTTLGRHSQNGDTVTVPVDEDKLVEVAVEYLNQLIAQSVTLLLDSGFLSPQAWEALICPDGMIHDAASRLNCGCVTDTCYQPTSADASRPCPARAQGLPGCSCDTLECASVCRRATPRDPEARFIRYRATNQPDSTDQENDATKGEPRYGYASLPLLLADPSRRFHIVLADHFSAASARLELPFAAQLLQLDTLYPSLHVRDVVGDAAFGYSCVLRVVHEHLGARRVIDLRAHQTDQDKTLWPLRGYDDKGRPICAFGYPFTSSGFDFEKRRHKWFCDHVCQKGQQPVVVIPGLPTPISECPYLHTDSNYGQILNIGFSFKNDGSCRLVRDIAFDSPAWKQLYHRARSASESRNATFERWGLKRLPALWRTPRQGRHLSRRCLVQPHHAGPALPRGNDCHRRLTHFCLPYSRSSAWQQSYQARYPTPAARF